MLKFCQSSKSFKGLLVVLIVDLKIRHPTATIQQQSSDLFALYGVHVCARGWMLKSISKYSAKREHLFAPNL